MSCCQESELSVYNQAEHLNRTNLYFVKMKSGLHAGCTKKSRDSGFKKQKRKKSDFNGVYFLHWFPADFLFTEALQRKLFQVMVISARPQTWSGSPEEKRKNTHLYPGEFHFWIMSRSFSFLTSHFTDASSSSAPSCSEDATVIIRVKMVQMLRTPRRMNENTETGWNFNSCSLMGRWIRQETAWARGEGAILNV